MPDAPSIYEQRERAAVDVLEKARIRIDVERVTAAPLCPTWGPDRRPDGRAAIGPCRKCNGTHGDHYRITVTRRAAEPIRNWLPGGKPEYRIEAAYTCDFWGSYSNSAEGIDAGKGRRSANPRPKVYHAPDVVECLLMDRESETTPDEVYAEFGPMEPSRCIQIADHARRLREVIPDDAAEEARDVLDGRDEETAADADMTQAGG